MRIEFPREELLPCFVEPFYRVVMDMHTHYENLHKKQEYSYIKYAGFFLVTYLGFMLMEGKGIIMRTGVNLSIVVGIGASAALVVTIALLGRNMKRNQNVVVVRHGIS